MKPVHLLIPVATLLLSHCIVVEDTGSATQLPAETPNYGAPLTAETGAGAVTIREADRVVTSFRTARPNVEETRWYAEQEQIVVKSRGNHGPATVELFDSRNGRKLGSVMAYEAASGPAWARSMAE